MTLALVATLGTRALADTDVIGDGDDVSSLLGASGEPDDQPGTDQAQTGTRQQAAGDIDGNSDGVVTDSVVTGGATGSPQDQSGGVHPQTPAAVAQGRQDPDGTDEQVAVERQEGDRAGQEGQRGGPGECAGDGCSTAPPDPGDPTVAAAAGAGDWWSRHPRVASWAERLGLRQPQTPEEPAQPVQTPAQPVQTPAKAPSEPTRRLDMVAQDLGILEAREATLADEGRMRTPVEEVDDRATWGRISAQLGQVAEVLDAEVTPEEVLRYQDLDQRFVAFHRRFNTDLAGYYPTPGTALESAARSIRLLEVQHATREAEGLHNYYLQTEQETLQAALDAIERARAEVTEESPDATRLADLETRAAQVGEWLASERSAIPTAMTFVEGRVRGVERLEGRLAQAGRTRTPSEQEDAGQRLAEAAGLIPRLREQAAQGIEDPDTVAALARRVEEARRRLEAEPPHTGQQQMSVVDAGDVGGSPGFSPPPVRPGQAGFGSGRPEIPDLTGYGSDRPRLPVQTVFTVPKPDTRPLIFTPSPSAADTRPLTRDQEATQGTSDTAERLQHASQTTAKYGLVAAGGLALTGLYYTWLALQAAYGGLAGLMPAEVLKNLPGAAPRPTQS
jgi:hypothetical protein